MAQDMITEEYKIISTPFDPGNSTFFIFNKHYCQNILFRNRFRFFGTFLALINAK